jgi:hypothetical protein
MEVNTLCHFIWSSGSSKNNPLNMNFGSGIYDAIISNNMQMGRVWRFLFIRQLRGDEISAMPERINGRRTSDSIAPSPLDEADKKISGY